jgi:hypothetical protein
MAQQMRYIRDIYSDAQYLRYLRIWSCANLRMREFLLRHYCAIIAPLLRHYISHTQ